MAFKWTEDLSVGVTEIDNQHKELFKQIDNLLSAMSTGKGKDEVGKIINFLGNYVIEHFGMEEKKMLSMQYPNYPAHKAIHTAFISSFTEIKKNFDENGSTSTCVLQVNRQVNDWLKSHICNVDKELGKFLIAA